jgi:adenine C2-methylase RlmN of 23S rRNA A2503 and tRNA A37
VVQAQHSADGETTKLLLQLQDGLTVESVIMHYDTSGAGLFKVGMSRLHVLGFAARCSMFFLSTCNMATGVTDTGRGDSDADSCVTAGGSRATLCVSSEVGCQMGCTFCATGTMGLKVTMALCPETVRWSLTWS